MKKKVYIAPVCEVIEMETNVNMMAASVDIGTGDDIDDGFTQDANRHRGTWGNLWGRGE